MPEPLAEAIGRVFLDAILQARNAARFEDKAAVVRFMNLTSALEEAYPEEIAAAYAAAGVTTAGQG